MNFPMIVGERDPTTADGDEALMQLVNERVGRAAHELTPSPTAPLRWRAR